jgi:Ca2+-binding EF-hand superfamily protein
MTSRIALCSLLCVPMLAQAQTVPALHPYSGLNATASVSRLERDGPRFAGPRSDASAMKAPPAIETFPLLRLPGKSGPATKDADLIRRVKPAYRLADAELNIPDVQDVVFFTETRIVRVRLHLKVAGEPMSKAWVKQLRRYFDYLDRDGDGVLNAYEADFVFSNRAVQQMLQSGNAFINPTEPGRTLADFDRDGDGVISFDEFVAYYAPSAQALMRVQPSPNRDAFAETLTDELFKLLDRDHDGKLSRAELADAEKLLPLLDQNEDECLSALELVPNLFNRPRPAPPVGGPMPPRPAPPTEALQIYRAGTIPDTIVEQILARYDKDKNLRLTKAESGFDDATFAKLDKNSNGELTITELLAWRDLPPDLDLALTFSPKQSECIAKVIGGPMAGNVKVGDEGRAYVLIGKQQIDLGVTGSLNVNFNRGQQFLFTFQQADPENKGYITEKDIAGPQFQFLRVIFDIVDRDGDGKMTRKEFTDYFDLQQSFTDLPLAVTHITQTPSLFSLIDVNGDGRLCVRELRNAWSRLKDLEPGGGEYITRAAIQPHATIRFTRASQAFNGVSGTNLNPTVPVQTKGPLWFRKMDRNGDGDVSRSEFPGRPEEFDKLDLDHDGLISVEEAEAADKQFRPPMKQEKK